MKAEHEEEIKFLMYRVELKAAQVFRFLSPSSSMFLMYRVELKDPIPTHMPPLLTSRGFLMYRVELKVCISEKKFWKKRGS
jgi:hypothetical protein